MKYSHPVRELLSNDDAWADYGLTCFGRGSLLRKLVGHGHLGYCKQWDLLEDDGSIRESLRDWEPYWCKWVSQWTSFGKRIRVRRFFDATELRRAIREYFKLEKLPALPTRALGGHALFDPLRRMAFISAWSHFSEPVPMVSRVRIIRAYAKTHRSATSKLWTMNGGRSYDLRRYTQDADDPPIRARRTAHQSEFTAYLLKALHGECFCCGALGAREMSLMIKKPLCRGCAKFSKRNTHALKRLDAHESLVDAQTLLNLTKRAMRARTQGVTE